MVFKHVVEVGQVAYISFGLHAAKLVKTLDVIDQNTPLVDGPCTQLRRQALPFKCMWLTDLILKCPQEGRYQEAISWAEKTEARERKAKMTALINIKLLKAKKMRNRIIKLEVRKLQKATLLEASTKKTPTAKGSKTPAQKTPALKAADQKAVPPKAQKGHKDPTQKSPAPKASGKKA
ncbi:unnamed protein product [Nyctereutes procyonoides]|uniref:(raccoon dog) hypothetical protein n=1 Tax=Nyctereutes procyonoides TaxID=34880 RepID=A0A811YN58_NYCPR|nr:unnamed protein product [Nyctereutes procyonoides]